MFKFMKKALAIIGVLSLFGLGALLADKQYLKTGLVRLHVVANSNTQEDQQIKLHVRDAVLNYLEANMSGVTDAQSAMDYLGSHLNELEKTANETLSSFGISDSASVTLTKEKFGVRQYDTFTLPSGVYESLRVEIGEAAGENWWCVVFPALCTGASTEEFKDTAATSGFNDSLTNTLAEDSGYEIRFFLLDCLGKLENFFFRK